MSKNPVDKDDVPSMVESLVSDSSVEARVYDTLLSLSCSAPVEDIADLSLCKVEEAEDALELFVEFDIAQIHTDIDGRVEYGPNTGYFLWRHAHKMAGNHTVPELSEIEEQIETAVGQLKETYGVDEPDGIPLTAEDSDVRQERQDAVELWRKLIETRDGVQLAMTLQQLYSNQNRW